MAILTGYLGFVRFNNQGTGLSSFHATHWTVDWRVDPIDTSTFINSGVGTYTPGVFDYDITVDFIYDTLDNAFAVKTNFTPGFDVETELFLIEGNVTQRFYFPKVMISNMRIDDSIRDVVRYSMTGRANHMDPSSSIANIEQPRL
jgi:hypothetical protein